MEIWKDIQGFDGYQISDKGRVRTHNKVTSNSLYSHRLWKDRIIKQKVSKRDGRARVCIWADGKEYTFLVHRLQATAFIGDGLSAIHYALQQRAYTPKASAPAVAAMGKQPIHILDNRKV